MEIINVVIDLSHHNRVADFQLAKADSILGVIHKATQGFDYVDPKYQSRRPKALQADLMWGAYHFGVGGDGVAQAKHFLEIVQPEPHDLLVLDLEYNPQGRSMNIDEAEEFVEYVNQVTNRWPGLYSGNFLKEILGNQTDTVLANCWLWFARYGPPPKVPPAWPTWTMWQYTDGACGDEPHEVQGIGPCDRDKFNGNLAALKKLWGYQT
jgi:lysozyme